MRNSRERDRKRVTNILLFLGPRLGLVPAQVLWWLAYAFPNGLARIERELDVEST